MATLLREMPNLAMNDLAEDWVYANTNVTAEYEAHKAESPLETAATGEVEHWPGYFRWRTSELLYSDTTTAAELVRQLEAQLDDHFTTVKDILPRVRQLTRATIGADGTVVRMNGTNELAGAWDVPEEVVLAIDSLQDVLLLVCMTHVFRYTSSTILPPLRSSSPSCVFPRLQYTQRCTIDCFVESRLDQYVALWATVDAGLEQGATIGKLHSSVYFDRDGYGVNAVLDVVGDIEGGFVDRYASIYVPPLHDLGLVNETQAAVAAAIANLTSGSHPSVALGTPERISTIVNELDAPSNLLVAFAGRIVRREHASRRRRRSTTGTLTTLERAVAIAAHIGDVFLDMDIIGLPGSYLDSRSSRRCRLCLCDSALCVSVGSLNVTCRLHVMKQQHSTPMSSLAPTLAT